MISDKYGRATFSTQTEEKFETLVRQNKSDFYS